MGKRFPLDGIDVRAVAAANGPEGLVALSGRQGLWLASPEDSSGERCLTRAISKDTAGKWLDLGSVSWCPDLRKTGWLATVRQRTVLLWDAGISRACGNIELTASVRAVTDIHWGSHLATGAMDGSVRLHDHRDLRQVAAVFNSRSNGYTQVRINNTAPLLLASAHAGYLLVWDVRSPKRALSSIIAHVSNKVGKFDWGRHASADHIVTCSPMEYEVKSWKMQPEAAPDRQPTPAAALKYSSMVASALMAPSGTLVLTAHADARLRLCALPMRDDEPSMPVTPATPARAATSGGSGSVGEQKLSQVLLSCSTGGPVERRVDVGPPLPGAIAGAGDGASDFRVVAVTAPAGGGAAALREWLITSQVAAVTEPTEMAAGGGAGGSGDGVVI
ncbi:MAG: hypothetical protein ACPIOQ_11300 [Promethearchaeia archaeon]